jgi:hypothetical protein
MSQPQVRHVSIVPHPPSTPKPDNSELWSLAETLGIDLPAEKHLLHIVRSAMKADLPVGWTAHRDAHDTPYYFNSRTGQSLWFRPITASNHEAVKLARLNGAQTVPSQVPSSRASMPASSSIFLTPTSQTPKPVPSSLLSRSVTSSRSVSQRGSQEGGFSLEVQQKILQELQGNSKDMKHVQRIQEFFRRWREKKQAIIKAKVRAGRATMDADMMARLAGGKRRTLEAAADAFSPARKPASTVPTTPNVRTPRPTSAEQSGPDGTPGGGTTGGGDVDAEKAKKRRASMMRMLSIQQRFLAEPAEAQNGVSSSVANGSKAASSSAAIQSAASAMAAPASSSSSSSSVTDGDDSRRVRLNHRRRTLTEDQAITSSSSSSSSVATPSRPTHPAAAPSTPFQPPEIHARFSAREFTTPRAFLEGSKETGSKMRRWQFVRIVLKMQRKFREKRAELLKRKAQKVAAQQQLQTVDADRRLRRASLPMSDLDSIRKRLSSGVPAGAVHAVSSTAAAGR